VRNVVILRLDRRIQMRNIKLTIEYDGTNYCGWQRQARLKSIQAVIEQSLNKLLQQKVKVFGSGRTDAGVHAKGQVANFQAETGLGLENIRNGLNALLPEEIAVREIKEVSPGFNSRYAAKSKVYRYTILRQETRSPFFRNHSLFIPYGLNIEVMKKAASYLEGRHNFRSFQTQNKENPHPERTIKRLKINAKENFIYIDIEADGFLHNMVRRIVGVLLEVGRGKLKPVQVRKILEANDPRLGGPTVPARGLCLMRVKYPAQKFSLL